jgi:hypothetical protein
LLRAGGGGTGGGGMSVGCQAAQHQSVREPDCERDVLSRRTAVATQAGLAACGCGGGFALALALALALARCRLPECRTRRR